MGYDCNISDHSWGTLFYSCYSGVQRIYLCTSPAGKATRYKFVGVYSFNTEAMSICDHVLNCDPTDCVVLQYKAQLLLQANKFADAIQYLQRLLNVVLAADAADVESFRHQVPNENPKKRQR